MINDELLIIQKTINEGIGSVYEHVILYRFLLDLCQKYQFQTVLEYPASITKGFDNLAFLRQDKAVTIADPQVQKLENLWPFDIKPQFFLLDQIKQNLAPSSVKRFNLVWNFAQVQLDPSIIDTIISHSQKYILIFTPNILNWGTSFHVGYHLLFGQECHHAERGSIKLRTKSGLTSFLESKGLKILETGYIDSPLIPDIGFSIKELKSSLGIKAFGESKSVSEDNIDAEKIHSKVENLSLFEYKKFPLKFLVAHHIYVLCKILQS